MKLETARIRFDSDGALHSESFDDVYFSKSGGADETRYVFMRGNRLQERWEACDGAFSIGELGFGTGLNFLAVLREWARAAKPAQATLHFHSCEKHPIERADLERFWSGFPEFRKEAADLLKAYPSFVSGMHALDFPEYRAVLNLYLGDAEAFAEEIASPIDAWFLDGFTPARNPGMWTPRVARSIFERTREGGTFATYSVSKPVKDAFSQAGFHLEKDKGFGTKREMLTGRKSSPDSRGAARSASKKIAVIGAGLAGCAIASELCKRGHQITLLDRADAICSGASGNPIGLFMPYLGSNGNEVSRYALLSLGYLIRLLERADPASPLRFSKTGVLRNLRLPKEIQKLRRALELHAFEPDFARPAQASFLGETRLLKEAGWIIPRTLAEHFLCEARASGANPIQMRLGTEVRSLAELRRTLDTDFDAVVLCASWQSNAFLKEASAPETLSPLRGQVVWTQDPEALRAFGPAPVMHSGYLVSTPEGSLSIGASFERGRLDARVDPEITRELVGEALSILPEASRPTRLLERELEGRVSFRGVTPDKLPLVGPVSSNRSSPPEAQEPDLHAFTGFGSRGLCYIPWAARVLAQRISGEPLCISRSLLKAIEPSRFEGR